MPAQRYFGKYRGTVVNNLDPEQRGRIQVMVPDVSNLMPSSWAMPCFPVGGMQTGFFAVPLVGAGVWVEFEQGNPDYPIWTGCYYGSAAEVPATVQTAPPPIPAVTIQTPLMNSLQVSDLPGPTGGIVLRSATGASIIVNDTGIYIQNGRGAAITLIGPLVSVNNGALDIL